MQKIVVNGKEYAKLAGKDRKVRRNDKVVVISGNEKGKTGIVTKVMPKEEKVIVAGLNYKVKNIKAGINGSEGGQMKIEGPIHVSNVMVIEKGEVDPKKMTEKGDE